MEKKYATLADCILTVNASIAEMLQRTFPSQPVHVVRNTPVINPYAGPSLREITHISEDGKILLYVGKISKNRGLDWIVEHLPHLPEIHFVCVGHHDSTMVALLERIVARHALHDRVHLLPPVPHDEVVSFIEEADVGICAINPVTKSYYYSLPNKVFEMSMAGMPVVATDLPEIRQFLEQVGNGFYFSASTPEDMRRCILQAFNAAKSTPGYYKNTQSIARQHDWSHESQKLVEVIQTLVQGRDA